MNCFYIIYLEMAEAQVCSVCTKRLGVYTCTGCKAHFCKKDNQDHREKMVNELDGYTADCNEFQDKINQLNPQKDSDSPIYAQINAWENRTINMVHQVADQARQDCTNIWHAKKVDTTARFDKFLKQLIEMKETEDFVEPHLEQVKQTIYQLRQDLRRLTEPSIIELNMEHSDKIVWDRLIYVQEKHDYTKKETEFDEKSVSIIKQVDPEEKPAPNMKQIDHKEKFVSIVKNIDDQKETAYPMRQLFSTSPFVYLSMHQYGNLLTGELFRRFRLFTYT